ncbi:unnamed protein product [marine sediment metagenome]|uniref:Uncharacterized protein n=1 Tax=marine sediment metagenome TaxID=412755 RepID=X1S6X9_9ZZZZ
MVLYFMVDQVAPWIISDPDNLVLWVDGGIWDNSIWDPQVDDIDQDEDNISERVLVV